MEYTKGEWKIEDGTQVMCGDRLVANAGGYSINIGDGSCRRENIANAHLIAAAPALYEALGESANVLLVVLDLMNTPEGKHAVAGMIEQNRKALAKADGK